MEIHNVELVELIEEIGNEEIVLQYLRNGKKNVEYRKERNERIKVALKEYNKK
jgi:hypothetical protein